MVRLIWDIISSKRLLFCFIWGLGAYIFIISLFSSGSLYEVGPISILIENMVKGRVERIIFILFLINLLAFIIRNRIFKGIPLFFLLLGIFLSIDTRVAKEVTVYEGDEVFLKRDLIWVSPYSWSRGWKEARTYEYSTLSFKIYKIDPMLNEYMQLKSKRIFLLWDPVVYLKFRDRVESLSPYPPKKIGGFYIQLTGIGPAPYIEIWDKLRGNLYNGPVTLRLLPVGMEDYFRLKEYTFYMSLSPVSKLNNPIYKLRILKNGLPIHDGVVRTGDKIRFDTNKLLIMGKTKYFARISVVKDRGIFWVSLGVAMTVLYSLYLIALKIYIACRN